MFWFVLVSGVAAVFCIGLLVSYWSSSEAVEEIIRLLKEDQSGWEEKEDEEGENKVLGMYYGGKRVYYWKKGDLRAFGHLVTGAARRKLSEAEKRMLLEQAKAARQEQILGDDQ